MKKSLISFAAVQASLLAVAAQHQEGSGVAVHVLKPTEDPRQLLAENDTALVLKPVVASVQVVAKGNDERFKAVTLPDRPPILARLIEGIYGAHDLNPVSLHKADKWPGGRIQASRRQHIGGGSGDIMASFAGITKMGPLQQAVFAAT